jgi:hypothetical protein
MRSKQSEEHDEDDKAMENKGKEGKSLEIAGDRVRIFGENKALSSYNIEA